MKKIGFTISELMISLSIVTVVTVMLIPSIVKLTPDNNKLKVINTHSKVVTNVEQLLDNDSIYYCEPDAGPEGLACTDTPSNKEFNDVKYSGDNKFENLLAYKLNLEETGDAGDLKWKESNGVTWKFEGVGSNNDKYYIITIDTNGKKGENKYYGESDCTKPDRFRFKINNYGGVIGYDAMTEAYLRNSMKSNSKDKDRDLAAKIAKTKSYK